MAVFIDIDPTDALLLGWCLMFAGIAIGAPDVLQAAADIIAKPLVELIP